MSALLSDSGDQSSNATITSNNLNCVAPSPGGIVLGRLPSITIPQSIQIVAQSHSTSRRQSSKQVIIDDTPPSSRTLSKEMIYQSKQQRKQQQQEKLANMGNKSRRKAAKIKSTIQPCCSFTPNLPTSFPSETDLNNNNTSNINIVMTSTESSTSIADSSSSSTKSSSFLPSAHSSIRPLSFLSHSLEPSSSNSSMNDSSSMDQRHTDHRRIDTDSFVNQNLGLDLNHSIVTENVLNVIELAAQQNTSLVNFPAPLPLSSIQTPSSSFSATSVSENNSLANPTYTINCPPEWHSRLNRMITCFILLKKITESKERMNEQLRDKKIKLKCSVCGHECSSVEKLLEHKEKSYKCLNEIELSIVEDKQTGQSSRQQQRQPTANSSKRPHKLSNFRRKRTLSSLEYLNQEESVETVKKKTTNLASTVRRKYNKRRFSCLNNSLTCESNNQFIYSTTRILNKLRF